MYLVQIQEKGNATQAIHTTEDSTIASSSHPMATSWLHQHGFFGGKGGMGIVTCVYPDVYFLIASLRDLVHFKRHPDTLTKHTRLEWG